MAVGKRFAGIALIIATALVVAIVSAHIGDAKGLAGSARPGPMTPPPTVGECLLEPTGQFGGWGFGEPLYPALRLAPCSGDRWGEVASVLPGALAAPTSVTTTDASGAQVTDMPNQDLCYRNSLAYLGVPAGLNEQRGWDLQIGTVAAIGPTLLQRTAGQSWVACVVMPSGGQAATPVQYRGSVRNALNAGALPATFTTCSSAFDAAGILPNPCDQPHRVEVFGFATIEPGDTQAGLNASCLQLVKWLMRTPDPTKHGLLGVRAFTDHTDKDGGAVEGLGANGDAACIVEPTVRGNIRGTLFGLAANPVPWA